jgi:hypothetical protein
MNIKTGWVLILAACVLFIALIVPYADSPLLYDVQTSARTSHHTNPGVFGAELTTRSDSVFADMQYLLDANEQIIRYIRAGDFIAAIHKYEQYDEKIQKFNLLVDNLGLLQSDIGTFADENVQNREIIFDIFIDSIRAAQLQNLQKSYEEQGDLAKAGEIRDERRKTYESLSAKRGQLIDVYQSLAIISEQYNLNDEAQLESIRSYDAYLSQVYYSLTGEVREEQEIVIPNTGDETEISGIPADIVVNRDRVRITFQISPESGEYGDQIRITGKLKGTDIANRVINIFIDNQNWATATTTESGTFETFASIEKITAGVHAVYCYSGISYSDIQLFTVDSSDSILTMKLEEETLSNNIICRGTLFAGDTPVKDAPVEIYVNNARKALLTTSEDGAYETVLTLSTGESTVQTVFQGQLRGFPINPSRSDPVSVTTGRNIVLLRGLLFIAGACILIFVGFRLIIPQTVKRARFAADTSRSKNQIKPPHSLQHRPPEADPGITPGRAFEDFLAFAQKNDWLNAIHVLYVSLKETMIAKRLVQRRRSLTPREVTRTFENNDKSDVLSEFMEKYEKIYYGRILPEIHEQETIAASWKSFLTALGDDDH